MGKRPPWNSLRAHDLGVSDLRSVFFLFYFQFYFLQNAWLQRNIAGDIQLLLIGCRDFSCYDLLQGPQATSMCKRTVGKIPAGNHIPLLFPFVTQEPHLVGTVEYGHICAPKFIPFHLPSD